MGNLTVVLKNPQKIEAIKSKFFTISTMLYLTPPAFGSRIVEKVLTDPELKNEWIQSVQLMSNRIKKIRHLLYDHLINLKTPGSWTHIIEQIGMFSFTGLTGKFPKFINEKYFNFKFVEEQCTMLTEKYHIYLPKTGRINMCGMNEENVGYVAKCIHSVLTYKPVNGAIPEFSKDKDSNIQLIQNVALTRNIQKTLVR